MKTEELRARLDGWLHDRPDDAVLRWTLRMLVAATIVVVGIDLLAASRASLGSPAGSSLIAPAGLRAPGDPGVGPNDQPAQTDARLGAAMTFDLVEGGRLMAVGAIDAGAADRFAAEIGKRGSYIRTVVLRSAGGSLADALAMGRLIRSKGLATDVEAGGTCASSCPLVLAGGAERRVGDGAAVGIHQVFAARGLETTAAAEGMADAQRVSARVQRYLTDMGVDPALWIHAMETPPDRIYVLKPAELTSFKLVTSPARGARG